MEKDASHPLEGFEERYSRLEQLVNELEAGNLPLGEMLKRFEEAVRLLKECDEMLKTAEERVELLTKNLQGEITGSTPYEVEDE